MANKYRYFLIKCNESVSEDLNLGGNCLIIKTDTDGRNMKHFHPKYGKFKSIVREFYCFFEEIKDGSHTYEEITRKEVSKYLLTYKLTK